MQTAGSRVPPSPGPPLSQPSHRGAVPKEEQPARSIAEGPLQALKDAPLLTCSRMTEARELRARVTCDWRRGMVSTEFPDCKTRLSKHELFIKRCPCHGKAAVLGLAAQQGPAAGQSDRLIQAWAHAAFAPGHQLVESMAQPVGGDCMRHPLLGRLGSCPQGRLGMPQIRRHLPHRPYRR